MSVFVECGRVHTHTCPQRVALGATSTNIKIEKKFNYIYKKLPRKPEELLNESACTHFHRTGLLCGDCEKGHSPFVFSYNLSCVRCPSIWWQKLVEVHLSRIFTTWNLDLLRSIIPDICFDVTTLQALALDCLIAFYPFMLILLSYIFIGLHGSHFTRYLQCFKSLGTFVHQLSIRLLLSFAIILKCWVSLLTFWFPLQSTNWGQTNNNLDYTRYTPTVRYLGDDHLPYAIAAIIILTLWVSLQWSSSLILLNSFGISFPSFH